MLAGGIDKQSEEDKLQMVKNYFKNKRRSGLVGLEDRYRREIRKLFESSREETSNDRTEYDVEDEKCVNVKTEDKMPVKVGVMKKKVVKDEKKHANKSKLYVLKICLHVHKPLFWLKVDHYKILHPLKIYHFDNQYQI